MLVVRLLAILTGFAIAANLLVWLFTGNNKYLQWAFRLAKAALLAGLLMVLLLFAERLILL